MWKRRVLNRNKRERRRNIFPGPRRRTRALWVLATILAVLLSVEFFKHSDDADVLALHVQEHSTASLQGKQINDPETRKPNQVVFVGLVKETLEVQNSTWLVLNELSCRHNVHVYITAAVINHAERIGNFCTRFLVELESGILDKSGNISSLPLNRVERLGIIRDAQRQRVKELFFPPAQPPIAQEEITKQRIENDHDSVVILSDLDLFAVPLSGEIMKRVNLIFDSKENNHGADSIPPIDAICATGRIYYEDSAAAGILDCKTGVNVLEKQNRNKNSSDAVREACRYQKKMSYCSDLYYDTFATVFLPDSFPYPIHKRIRGHDKKPYAGEDPQIWRMGGQKITQYLHKLAPHNKGGLVPVRSCFSGLTLYRASVWLEPRCQYSLYHHQNEYFWKDQPRDKKGELTILRYASKKDNQPCEHVVFHDCLHRTALINMDRTRRASITSKFERKSNGLNMVIDPGFTTYWGVP